ncbi:hypothetical protein [Roseateles sp. LYH14W]|uniref:Uncharacterized protein n=1 Tax=Pelomonas parva TaxID=3299032 RepID=A0ABW7F6K1_9BURK
MEFLKSLPAKVWLLAAVAAGSVVLATMDDAPPRSATPGAATQWQAQFAQGLQVSLRAVADGNERPAIDRTTKPR